MRRKIMSAVLALIMSAVCAVPALAATSSSRLASNKLEEIYHDYVETPSSYLTVDYATLLKDARSGDLNALAKDFNVNIVDITEPTADMAAKKPGKLQPSSSKSWSTAYIVTDPSKLNFNDINNEDQVGLKPILIMYEADGSLRVWLIVLNKTDKPVELKGIDAIQLYDDQGKLFAGGQNIQFEKPMTVQGNETPWFVILNFKEGTVEPGQNLSGLKDPKIRYQLRY